MHRRKRRAGEITNIVDARLKVLKIFILRATHPHCCARAYGPSFSATASCACAVLGNRFLMNSSVDSSLTLLDQPFHGPLGFLRGVQV